MIGAKKVLKPQNLSGSDVVFPLNLIYYVLMEMNYYKKVLRGRGLELAKLAKIIQENYNAFRLVTMKYALGK